MRRRAGFQSWVTWRVGAGLLLPLQLTLGAVASAGVLAGCVNDTPSTEPPEDVQKFILDKVPEGEKLTPLNVNFDDKITLVGAQVEPGLDAEPGTRIKVTMYWRVDKALDDVDWKLFTHVLDGSGERLMNIDNVGPLRHIRRNRQSWAPGNWLPGKVYEDTQSFTMPRKLKVFRTATGFDDAYVAAPSRKAALAAWGADADLFARGVAEEVTDPKLAKAAFARPGEVIRVSRGDLSAHLKTLGPRTKKEMARTPTPATGPRKAAKHKAPPKRDRVDAAEEALREARRRHATEAGRLDAERDAIERKLDALRAKQDTEIARLERKRDEAREAYREALDRWRG